MCEELVLRDDVDGISTLTINQPEKMNAASRRVLDALNSHLDEIQRDESVQAVVITGAGEEAFVAGADINELAARKPLDALEAYMQRTYDRLSAFAKPTVAAINGFALGGGCELAMACDIRIASHEAVFGLPETGLGILPSAGGTQRLVSLVGRGLATDMIISGRRLDSEEALRWGLITYRVPSDELLATAKKIALRVGAKGPTAIRLVREILLYSNGCESGAGQFIERLAQGILYSTAEKAEGTAAFLAKRHPDFKQVKGKHI